MAHQVERLSAKAVEKKSKPGYYCDGADLYLQVSPSLSKSWIFRYTRFAKTREMGLGSLRDFSLAEARERARKFRKVLSDGKDPIEVRDAQIAQERAQSANTLTFAECAERFIKAQKHGWKNEKHIAQWRRTLADYAGPIIGELPVSTVETAHVMRIVEPLWTEKTETASRLRGRIEKILDWAKVHNYRSGENPARWRGHLSNLLPKRSSVQRVRHLEALPYAEIGNFVRHLREQPGTAARALEFAILTAARSGEVRGAKPSEFDLDEALWTIPGERMKAGREQWAAPGSVDTTLS
jgi:hypothetical protein